MPIARVSAASTLNGNSKANLLFLRDLIGLSALDVSPKAPPVVPARSRDPQEVWGAFRSVRISAVGHPKRIRMDKGGEWKNEVWADPCSDGRIKLPFQGRVRAPGFLGVVMDLRDVSIIGRWRTVARGVIRFPRRSMVLDYPQIWAWVFGQSGWFRIEPDGSFRAGKPGCRFAFRA